MESYQDEREIDLKQLFLTVMAKWRVLLMCAAIGAILGAGYQTVRSLRSMSPAGGTSTETTSVTSDATGEEAGESIKQEYASYFQEIENHAKLRKYYEDRITQDANVLAQQTEYYRDSIVASLDPNRVMTSRASLLVEVSSKGTDKAAGNDIVIMQADGTSAVAGKDSGAWRILSLYSSGIVNGTDYSDIATKYETEPRYIAELVSCETDAAGGVLNITVLGTDEEMSEAVLDAVLEQTEALRADIQSAAGSHTLHVLRDEPHTEVNRSLFDTLYDDIESLQELRVRMTTNQSELSKLAEPAAPAGLVLTVEQDADSEEETVYVALDQGVITKSIVKYALIGFFGGLFGAAFLYALYYVLSGRVLSADEFNRRYRIKALSVLPGAGKSGLDAKIASFGNDRVYLNMTEEERVQVAASNFSVYAPDVKDVIVVGSVAAETLEAVAQLLRDKIKDVRFVCASHINENAASLEALKAHEHIILVERVLASAYGEVDREMQQLADWGKTVIGSVVIY